MNAEIIAVGSELLTPRRLDTNSLYVTGKLNELGVELVAKMVIGDEVARLTEAIRGALSRSEIVILSGGLGPTDDDVTRDAVARALGRALIYHDDICGEIEARFKRMNRPMVEINKRQAYVIDGAEWLPNPNGTAPGQWVEDKGRVVMLLPGPPNELKPMFDNECLPRLTRLLPPRIMRTLILRVAGMGESDLDQLISPVYREYKNPVTTVLAAPGDVQIHFRALCASAEEADSLLAEVGGRVEKLLGDRIYSRNGDPLETVIGERLRARGETLSVAESCTGGGLAGRITDIAGSSDYFVGGFVVYTNRMKTELLGVNEELLATHGAVSEPVAEAMAAGARERTGSTYALSITGFAGPAGGTETAPAGTVVIGLASPSGCRSRRFKFIVDRARIRTLAAQNALDMLRKSL
ncbi:MAG: competence/damage-inducible protein A [Bryobacteraceae bacterium]